MHLHPDISKDMVELQRFNFVLASRSQEGNEESKEELMEEVVLEVDKGSDNGS